MWLQVRFPPAKRDCSTTERSASSLEGCVRRTEGPGGLLQLHKLRRPLLLGRGGAGGGSSATSICRGRRVGAARGEGDVEGGGRSLIFSLRTDGNTVSRRRAPNLIERRGIIENTMTRSYVLL